MKRIEDYVHGERIAFYWPGERRTVNAVVLEPHVATPNCRAYLIAIVTTPDVEGNEVLVENHDLREPFDEPQPPVVLTAEAVLGYASPDVLAGLIADCQRSRLEWFTADEKCEAIEKLAMTALVALVGEEEAAAEVAQKIALG